MVVTPTVPGPLGPDMLRAFKQIRRDPLSFLADCSQRYGPLVEFPIPRQRVLFVNSPEGVKQVLQTQHRVHDRQTVQYRSLAMVTGNGLLVSDGELWKRQRRLMQPAFHRAVLDAMVEHMDIAVQSLLHEWDAKRDGDVVDVDAAMMRVALEVVGRALFSTDLSGDAERIVKAVLDALEVVVARARSPLSPPLTWPTPHNRQLKRSLAELDAAVDRMVTERRRAGRTRGTATPDLLGLLIDATDDESGAQFDDQQLRDEIVTLIVAGHETVASSLTWTWHLLATNHDAEKNLHAEVDVVLGGRRPELRDLEQLPYVRQVVDEALRLYPPAWVISRRAQVDEDVLGHEVTAGSYVFMSPYVLQRSPEFWEDPNAFRPERFADPGSIDRYAYIPFGVGPNLCIGRDFALMESVVLVAAIASRWQLRSVAGHQVVGDPAVTIRPRGGLPMALVRRG